MNLGKLFAGLASAAFVAVVMLFGSAPAQAHTGYEHGSHMSHARHFDAATQKTVDTVKVTASKPVPQEVSASMDGGRGGDQGKSNCVGGCCGSGLGCCGAVMGTAQQGLPDFEHRNAIAALDFDYCTGIDPDALKRPPRTFA